MSIFHYQLSWLGTMILTCCFASIVMLQARTPSLQERPHKSSGPALGQHPVNCWVLQSPRPDAPAPDYPYEGSGVYDPYTGLWIHHGGHDGIPQGFHTFVFDLKTGRWQQRFPPTSPPGACCVDGANVFDRTHRVLVRFPGGSLGHGYQWSRGVKLKESHVWIYDPQQNEFHNMRPPPYGLQGRRKMPVGGLNSSGTYDSEHELVLSFGGVTNAGRFNYLFAYDLYANELYILPARNAPPPRDGAGIAYDAKHNKVVLFGSQYLVDNRTWVYDFIREDWEAWELVPHPPAHKVTKDYCTIPRLAYDARNGIVLCLVWLNETQGHETWALDLGKRVWRKLEPPCEPHPSKSRSRNLDYDAERNLFILESSSAKTNRPEIWTYRYAEAPADERPRPPYPLRAITQANGTVHLTWPAVSGAQKYRVYRAVADLPWKTQYILAEEVTKPHWHDPMLARDRTTWYRVTAVDAQGRESAPSGRARSRPRVPEMPIVSVLGKDQVHVRWRPHAAEDVVGYHVYRGNVIFRALMQGNPGPWRDNDPQYDSPHVVEVVDIVQWQRLTREPISQCEYSDKVNLESHEQGKEAYPWLVFAYVVRAVNHLGLESGPSPYALTIPSEPCNVFCREDGDWAELQWEAAREQNIAGYHVYMLRGTWEIVRVTEKPVTEPKFRYRVGKNRITRFWVTAIDRLGQEGQPSSPAWFGRSYRGFYEGDWHQ
ncbi:MAG: hypothetical protein RMJ19_14265 [Gemmatales bacterium]|nr:hypothetical protein [Gemmatales bacterium]MCS7161633.1 hypothetical protein [Gemmatales bacterium]MDW8176836.1 hypothetical protein [Gemmatales bacterium]MDW8221958.1 hypothetical protein [Gemmatales bacterium]